jgi:hypothetical protein
VKIPLVLLWGGLAVCAAAAEALRISDETLRDYRSLHKMTDKPHQVDTEIMVLCSAGPRKAATERNGPHYGFLVNVFMNDVAQKHFASGSKEAYPAGSIVVKEKLPAISPAKAGDGVAAVAGFIKHAAGYNAGTKDWEAFYVDDKGAMERDPGKLTSCANCHKNALTDFVYGDFAKPPPAKAPPRPL